MAQQNHRDRFVDAARSAFAFLSEEFNFDSPTLRSQSYSDVLVFLNAKGAQIEISRAFHGNDYGFEINQKDSLGKETMLYSVAKEKFDEELKYLSDAALFLAKNLEL